MKEIVTGFPGCLTAKGGFNKNKNMYLGDFIRVNCSPGGGFLSQKG